MGIAITATAYEQKRPSKFVPMPDGSRHEIKKPRMVIELPVKPIVPPIYEIAASIGINCESGFDKNNNWLFTRFDSDADQCRAHAEQSRLIDELNKEKIA